jgi:hypothetical protein
MKRHFIPGVVDRHGRARPDLSLVERVKLQDSIIASRESQRRNLAEVEEAVKQYPELAGPLYTALASCMCYGAFWEATCEARWNVTADSLNARKEMAMEEDVSYAFDEQGQRATNPVPRISPLAGVPVQVTGGPVPRRRRARHFFRALWRFLTARRIDL